MTELSLTSPVFGHNDSILSRFTCDGNDTNPPLTIGGVPEGTQSFVLIVDDPDAPGGTWDHWVLFNIPPETKKIDEDSEPEGISGENSWGNTGYGGPCPPSGIHHYHFKLYALDTVLDLPEKSLKETVEEAMVGHVLAQAELIGVYERIEQK